MAFETFSLADAMRPAQAARQQNLQEFSLALQARQLQQSSRAAAAKTKRDERKLKLDEEKAALDQAKHHLNAFEAITTKVDDGNYDFLKPSIARMLDVKIDAMPGTAEGLVGEYQIAKTEYEQARAANEEAFGRFKSLGGGKYLERTDAGVEVKGGAAKWDDANILLPTGETVSGRVNKTTGQRQVKTDAGWEDAPKEARAVGLSVQAAKASDLTPSQRGKVKIDLRELEINTKNMIRRAENLIGELDKLGSKPLSVTGFLARGIDTVAAQAEALAEASGIKIEASDSIADYQFEGELAEASAAVKSKVLSLAFALAMSKGQTGRGLSDQDVQRMLDILGSNSGSAGQMAAAIRSEMTEVKADFSTRHKTITGDEYQWTKSPYGNMTLKDLEALDMETMTAEELQQASERWRELNQ